MTTITGAGPHASASLAAHIPASIFGVKGYLTLAQITALVSVVGGSSDVVSVTDPTYGATGNGVTDDRAAIQSALNAVGTAGGGVVHLPAGTYLCSNGLLIPDNVWLRGCGRASVITNPAGALPGVTAYGVTIYASICLLGTQAGRVSHITVDHRIHSTTANHIQIGENGASQRANGCIVDHNYIRTINNHQYSLYNKCADGTIIYDNYVEAAIRTSEDTTGIEIYGGNDVIAYGNRLERLSTGIVVWNETLSPDSDINRVLVTGNIISDCAIGLHPNNADAARTYSDVIFANNVVTGCSSSIKIDTAANSSVKNLRICNNITRDATSSAFVAYITAPNTNDSISIDGNVFHTAIGRTVACAVSLSGCSGLNISNNELNSESGAYVISITGCDDITISNNDVRGGRNESLHMEGINSNTRCVGNTFSGYRTDAGSGTSINFQGSGIIDNNYFEHSTPSTPIELGAGTTWADVVLGKNNLVSWAGATSIALSDAWNYDVALNGRDYVSVAGPTTTFGIAGLIPPAVGGHLVTIVNPTANNMQFANESSGAAAANRIRTQTGTTVTLTGQSAATLRYDAAASRWMLLSTQG